jgi:hypothetical protein
MVEPPLGRFGGVSAIPKGKRARKKNIKRIWPLGVAEPPHEPLGVAQPP